MIGYISGLVKAIHKNYIIVATDHVGYKVFVTPQMSLSAAEGKSLSLYIHTYVREDQISLYGFPTLRELDFFELLMSVSGIGPKSALSIMSVADMEILKTGISSGDTSVFIKVSGVGRKTAERLIVELREKVGEIASTKEASAGAVQAHADVIDVLMALGYSRTEARQATVSLPSNITNSEDKIREALRALAKQ